MTSQTVGISTFFVKKYSNFEAKLRIKAIALSKIKEYIRFSKFQELLVSLVQIPFIDFPSGELWFEVRHLKRKKMHKNCKAIISKTERQSKNLKNNREFWKILVSYGFPS